jgi:thiosulfate/3-mercaptopyruvate sulfurtransferase
MKKAFSVIVLVTALCGSVMAAKTPPTRTMLVQTSWLANHLNDRNIVLLHVGVDRKAYDQAHIPGARFLSLSDIAITRNGIPNELPSAAVLTRAFEGVGVGDKSRVVLYGDELGMLAARAWFTLDYVGKTPLLLDGGLERWKTEHREVTTVVPLAPRPIELTAKVHPELLAELPGVQEMVRQKTVPLIDARPPAQYSGMEASEGVKRPGHIPGAKNVFWMDNLVSKQDPVLKPLDEIRARYEAAGLKPGSKVVVYCRSGMQAAHDYLTLKLTGFQPVLYDGSFFEWNQQAGNEIETGAQGK